MNRTLRRIERAEEEVVHEREVVRREDDRAARRARCSAAIAARAEEASTRRATWRRARPRRPSPGSRVRDALVEAVEVLLGPRVLVDLRLHRREVLGVLPRSASDATGCAHACRRIVPTHRRAHARTGQEWRSGRGPIPRRRCPVAGGGVPWDPGPVAVPAASWVRAAGRVRGATPRRVRRRRRRWARGRPSRSAHGHVQQGTRRAGHAPTDTRSEAVPTGGRRRPRPGAVHAAANVRAFRLPLRAAPGGRVPDVEAHITGTVWKIECQVGDRSRRATPSSSSSR